MTVRFGCAVRRAHVSLLRGNKRSPKNSLIVHWSVFVVVCLSLLLFSLPHLHFFEALLCVVLCVSWCLMPCRTPTPGFLLRISIFPDRIRILCHFSLLTKPVRPQKGEVMTSIKTVFSSPTFLSHRCPLMRVRVSCFRKKNQCILKNRSNPIPIVSKQYPIAPKKRTICCVGGRRTALLPLSYRSHNRQWRDRPSRCAPVERNEKFEQTSEWRGIVQHIQPSKSLFTATLPGCDRPLTVSWTVRDSFRFVLSFSHDSLYDTTYYLLHTHTVAL